MYTCEDNLSISICYYTDMFVDFAVHFIKFAKIHFEKNVIKIKSYGIEIKRKLLFFI